MRKLVVLSPLFLLLPASAQIAAGMSSLQSFFQAYPTFSLALALMVVTVVFAKTALGAENNAIAAGLGVAVLIGVLVGVPETTARQYVNYILWIVVGGIFLGIIAKLLKGTGEGFGGLDIRWKLFFGSLGFFLIAIALSHLGLHQIAGILYFFAIAFFVFFAIAAIAAGAGKLGGVKLRKGKKEEEGKGEEEETSEVAEEAEEEAKEKRKVRKKLAKEIKKFVDIKEKEILKPLERLKELLEDRVTLYQIEVKEDVGITSCLNNFLSFITEFEKFLDSMRKHRKEIEVLTTLDPQKARIRASVNKINQIRTLLSKFRRGEINFEQLLALLQNIREKTITIESVKVEVAEISKLLEERKKLAEKWGKFKRSYDSLSKEPKAQFEAQFGGPIKFLEGTIKKFYRYPFYVFTEEVYKSHKDYLNKLKRRVEEIGKDLGFKLKKNKFIWAGKKVKRFFRKVPSSLGGLREKVGGWIAKHATYTDILDQLERKQDAYKKIIKEFGKVLNRLHVNIKFLIDLQSDIALVMDKAKEQGIEVDERKMRAAIRKAIIEEANVIYTIFKILGDRLGKEELEKIADKDFNAIIRLEKFGEQIKDDKKLLELLKRLHIFDRAEIAHIQKAFSEGILKLSRYQLNWLEGAAVALVRAESAMKEGRVKEAEDARREAEKMIDKLYASIAHEMDIWLNLDRYVEHFERLARKEDYIFKRILPWVEKVKEEAKEEEKKEEKEEKKVEKEAEKVEKGLKKIRGIISKEALHSVPSFLARFLKKKNPEKEFERYVIGPIEQIKITLEVLYKDLYEIVREKNVWTGDEQQFYRAVDWFIKESKKITEEAKHYMASKVLSDLKKGLAKENIPINARDENFIQKLKDWGYYDYFKKFMDRYEKLREEAVVLQRLLNKVIEKL